MNVGPRFYGKTWIFWAQLVVLGWLAGSCFMGVLFWFEIIRPADGRDGTGVGLGLTLAGIAMLPVLALAGFNMYARRHPVIRLYRGGIEMNLIGATNLDGLPFLPGWIRLAHALLTLQGFRTQTMRCKWDDLDGAFIAGAPMMRALTVSGSLIGARRNGAERCVGRSVTFSEAAFQARLEAIVRAIRIHQYDQSARAGLPEWPDVDSVGVLEN